MAEELLTFFVVTKSKTVPFVIRRLALERKAQESLHEHFIHLLDRDWASTAKSPRRFTPSWVLSDDEYFSISDFKLSDDLKRLASNPQHFADFSLPIPVEESLRGVIACNASLFLFQVCDSRYLVKPTKFALIFSGDNFKLANQTMLTMGDSLAGVYRDQSLQFLKVWWLGRLIDLGTYYEEASAVEAKTVFSHGTFKLPPNWSLETFVSILTPALRKKVAIVLRSKILDTHGVDADSINKYAMAYLSKEFPIKGKFGSRQIELPTEVSELRALLQCLEEQFFTSELTGKQRETNSYIDIEKSMGNAAN